MTICFLILVLPGSFALAKRFELTGEDVGRIETVLGTLKTFGNTVLPESTLKTALNTALSTGETTTDVTYGLLVLSTVDELEFIDMVISQRYKKQSTDYFNSILDRKLSLVNYYKGVGFDLPRIMSGKITSPIGALTLNTFEITGGAIEALTAIYNLRKVLIYDGLWRYFDSRRYNESHETAWDDAKIEMGFNVETDPFLTRKPTQNDISIEDRFAELWDKWGPYTTTAGVTEEGKRQFAQEMRGLVLEAVANQALAEKEEKPSFFASVKNVLGSLINRVQSVSLATKAKITSFLPQSQKEDTQIGISIVVSDDFLNQDNQEIENSESKTISVDNSTKSSFTNDEEEQLQTQSLEQKAAEVPQIGKNKPSDPAQNLIKLKNEGVVDNLTKSSLNSGLNRVGFEGCRDGQININSADAGLLDELTGIGSVKAQSIIELRGQKLFFSVDDLEKVSGIGEATLAKIKEQNIACAAARDANFVSFQKVSVSTSGGGGGGGGSSSSQAIIEEGEEVYSKILITEVQTAGIFSKTDEFVELYNPNDTEVDLTDWYLQKKTQSASGFSTFASGNLFSAKKIGAHGYFLIARQGSSFENQADILTSHSLAENNTLALKDPNGDIVDKLGWGNVQDYEGVPALNPSADSSLGRKYGSSYQDTNNNSEDFQVQIPSPKLVNPASQTSQEDDEENEEYAEEQDSTLPQISFNTLASTQASLYFNLAWSVSDSSENVSSSGLDGVSIQYAVSPSADGVFIMYSENDTWKDWQQGSVGELGFLSSVSAVSLSAQDGVEYIFSATAKDLAGNESLSVNASTSVSLAKTIVINEVAWAGTKASPTDEWIELLDTTDSSINLAGWSLRSSDKSGPDISLSGTIKSQSFYLIERTNENPTTETANLTVSFGNGLLNTDCEILSLYDEEENLIDQTVCNTDSSWPAGSAGPDYVSMERINSSGGGMSTANWADNNLIKHNAKDASNNFVNGTPKQDNSVSASSTELVFRFNEFTSMTLPILGSPYYTTDSLVIPTDKTLIVDPGVIIRFEGNNHASLTINGTLQAVGTLENQIIFRNSLIGNSWCGLTFNSTSQNSKLEYVAVERAAGCGSQPLRRSLMVDGSSITLKNVAITSGDSMRKIYLKNSDSIIDSATISGANEPNNPDAAGILIEGGNPTITNSIFSDNHIGIWNRFPSGKPTIANNTFTNNTYPIKLSSSSATVSGNSASGNTYNGIIADGTATTDLSWQADAIPYIVGDFTVNTGKKLTLQEGVIIKFAKIYSTLPGFVVNGILLAQGTAEKEITFTAVNDDAVGGDSFEGLNTTANWRRLYFSSTSTGSVLQNTVLKYGGNRIDEGVLYVDHSNLELQNVEIYNSLNSGIRSLFSTVSGSSLLLKDNAYGFYITGTCPSVSQVSIEGGDTLHPSSAQCAFD
ncbi:MAG: lamin tail domain-containing protein [Candidatus Wildermuthbacteria bacterium]|nr:lamin tail domain-containing protein [Candidatus Wildermuthbacteria bacterium]